MDLLEANKYADEQVASLPETDPLRHLLHWLHFNDRANTLMHPATEGWAHRSIEGLVLSEGTIYKGQPLPEGFTPMEKKMCFANAFELVLGEHDLTYVEGYALRPQLGLPMMHGWCIDGDDRVIDPTWDEPDTCVYIGIPFTRWDMVELLEANNNTLPVIDCWASGWELLKHGLDGECDCES